jgi:site-specific DNA-cytosine methylase
MVVTSQSSGAASVGSQGGSSAVSFKKVVKQAATNFKKSGTGEIPMKVITYGSDFTGMDAQSIALKALSSKFGLPYKWDKLFSSDNAKACGLLSQKVSKARVRYEDVSTRNQDEVPAVDFYQYTAPCQGISGYGKQDVTDPRTTLVTFSILYIRKKRPKCFVSEQVIQWGQPGKFRDLHDWVVAEHRKDGYHIEEHAIDSGFDYGLPQHRRRWYTVGILKDSLRARSSGISIFPDKAHFPTKVPFKFLVPPLDATEWKAHPPVGTAQYENVMAAYGKAKVNPFVTPVTIDAGASPGKFQSYAVNAAPTLAATRASQRGYWCSTKGGFLDVDQMASLQGFHEIFGTQVPWREAGVSVTQYGHMVGNGQSANFLLALYPRVLFNAQLITLAEYKNVAALLTARFMNLNLAGTPRDAFTWSSTSSSTASSSSSRPCMTEAQS